MARIPAFGGSEPPDLFTDEQTKTAAQDEDHILNFMVEDARKKCAEDHECDLDKVVTHKVQVNPLYDPDYKELRDYAPDRDKDPAGWYNAWKEHNYDGDATHVLHFHYPDEKGNTWQATYGINTKKERPPELWAD